MSSSLSVPAFLAWAEACLAALGAARSEIDSLNVYPVPDRDTGTNLYLTVESGVLGARAGGDDLHTVVHGFVDGALRGARGNSGVIVSQLLRAALLRLAPGAGAGLLDPAVVASAFRSAAAAALVAVAEPAPGTILTVAAAAAGAADAAVGSDATAGAVVRAAAEAASTALARTPEQLAVLRQAGVVDAGGRGLCVILDVTLAVVEGRHLPLPAGSPEPRRQLVDVPVGVLQRAYEVMYLLDADDVAVAGLRDDLITLGDSVVVVGGDGLWNVHAHVDDAGAAVEAGLAVGRPHRIRVTNLDPARARGPQRSGRSVVGMAAGPGLHKLLAAAGAAVVAVRPGGCTTADFLDAISGSGAEEVIVLPNDGDCIAAAEAAAAQARELGVRVAVLPTRTQVQGLAALAVFAPARDFDDDVVAMTSAAGHTRHGAVTVAERAAMTSAGRCEPGDALGVVNGDFVIVGGDLADVATQVVLRLLASGGELVTLVVGEDAAESLVTRVVRSIRSERPDVDPVVYDGGQQRYPLLVAVE